MTAPGPRSDPERAVRERFETALRAGGIGTWRWEVGTGHVDWDASLEELYGFAPGTFDGTYETYLARIHPEDRAFVEAHLKEALESRTPHYAVEHRIVLPGGSVRWVEATARLALEGDRAPAELIGVVVDVTERRRLEEERRIAVAGEDRARQSTRAVQRRMEMLARAASLVDAPFDLDATLQQVADLAIGSIAEWCTVDLVSDGRIHHAAVAHRDPAMVEVARDIKERFPEDPDEPILQNLLRTLEPIFVPDFDEAILDHTVANEEHRRLLKQLALSSYLVVPLVARGKGVGIMVLVACHGQQLDGEDVDLAVELGRRAGAAVDKARLYGELAETARVLQDSLLPTMLPHVPGLTLSAHYRSGANGAEIGGDYYDVFRTGRDRWWVVLGDVCGKGPGAAALTAAVRYTLHAIAADSDDPAVVLRRLNDILLANSAGTGYTTLVLVTFVSRPLATAQRGGDREPLELTLASGGHPPPLVRRADGSVYGVSSPGMIVGILPEFDAASVTVHLGPGETLLLYTDGATEARTHAGDELGETTLRRLLGADPCEPAGAVADRLAEDLLRLTRGILRDDLALLTLTR